MYQLTLFQSFFFCLKVITIDQLAVLADHLSASDETPIKNTSHFLFKYSSKCLDVLKTVKNLKSSIADK